mgnify:CR=1 FL=1
MEKYIAIHEETCSEAHDTPEKAVVQIISFCDLDFDDYKNIVITKVTSLQVKKPGYFLIVNDG